MAEVPEINDLPMDSYSEEEFYTDYTSEIKLDMNHLGWEESSCRSNITLKVKKPRKAAPSLKKAIKLLIIIGRVSGKTGFEAECLFNDHDLLNHILVEEEVFFRNAEESFAASTEFRYTGTKEYTVRDSRQKCLMLQEYQGRANLVALFLQGGNRDKQAKINVDGYKSTSSDRQAQPVTLGIVGRSLYLSCRAEEGDQHNPALSLTEASDIREKKNDDLLPFLFYRRVNETSSNTFESVAFPGWYISTSQTENQFVQMKPQNDQVHIRDFLLYLTS